MFPSEYGGEITRLQQKSFIVHMDNMLSNSRKRFTHRSEIKHAFVEIDKKSEETSHLIIGKLLRTLQITGCFPVGNIGDRDPATWKFSWVSHHMFFWYFNCFCHWANTFFWLWYAWSKEGSILKSLLIPCLGCTCSVAMICFMHIAKDWKNFILKLQEIESDLFRKYNTSKDLQRHLNIVLITLCLNQLVEHNVGILTTIYSHGLLGLEQYVYSQFPMRYQDMPYQYHLLISILLLCLGTSTVIYWTLADMFIISMSTIVSSRFKQISMGLETSLRNGENISHLSAKTETRGNFYKQIREDYNKMVMICKELNKLLSTMILNSYVGNVCVILIQLFNSLEPVDTQMERVHFSYSFLSIILRLVMVSIYAASVNEESKHFLFILNNIPSNLWHDQVERMIVQINFDAAILGGHGLFTITKDLVLKIAVAILSYELVLIQFNNHALSDVTSSQNVTRS